MKKLSVLIITAAWPPRNSIGAHRPYSWAKNWSTECDVTILTTRKYPFDHPLNSELPAVPGVHTIEVDYLPNALSQSIKRRVPPSLARYKKFFRSMLGVLGLNLHPRRLWKKAALRTLVELDQRFDVIVSTYDPEECHLIASEVKKRGIAAYWVADYRDLWSQNHALKTNRLTRSLVRRRELRTVGSGADLLTTVSLELAEQLRSLMPQPTHVIYNGYDTAFSAKSLSTPERSGGPFRIVHTGRVYEGLRDPTPLFDAILSLYRRGTIQSGQVIVQFYGPAEPVEKLVRESPDLKLFVSLEGSVSRSAALDAQQNADCLLLLESPSPEAKGVLTGKIFEYMAAGRPVISIGSSRDSAIGRLLQETGIGQCFGKSVPRIESFVLSSIIRGDSLSIYHPVKATIETYSRAKQARALYNIISETLI